MIREVVCCAVPYGLVALLYMAPACRGSQGPHWSALITMALEAPGPGLHGVRVSPLYSRPYTPPHSPVHPIPISPPPRPASALPAPSACLTACLLGCPAGCLEPGCAASLSTNKHPFNTLQKFPHLQDSWCMVHTSHTYMLCRSISCTDKNVFLLHIYLDYMLIKTQSMPDPCSMHIFFFHASYKDFV